MRRPRVPSKRGFAQVRGVVAIVPAAGSGRRLGLKTKKPFVMLAGKPLIWYALKALERSASVDAIIVAAEKSCVGRCRRLVQRFGLKKVIAVIEGGKERVDSVRNCLEKAGARFDIVLIHDGARPFVSDELIRESVRLARKHGGCIVAMAESDTVKLAGKDLVIKGTLDRSRVFRAQTPQVFKRSLIEKAYAARKKRDVTDDASLVESIGGRVKILPGACRNIKITTREDLRLAEILL